MTVTQDVLLPPLSTDVTTKAHNIMLMRLRARSLSDRLHDALLLSERLVTLSLYGYIQRNSGLSSQQARIELIRGVFGNASAQNVQQHLEQQPMTNIYPAWHHVVSTVVEVLEDLGVAYYLTGSVVSSTHGLPRGTNDVNIVAELAQTHVPELVARLTPLGYIDEQEVRDAVRRRSMFNMLPNTGPLRIDVIVPQQRPFQQSIFDRIRYVPLDQGARPYLLPTVEDMILIKLEWYHGGGQQATSEQWKDILGMLQLQAPTLDRIYLQRWATILDVQATLERAWGEAGL